MGLINLKTDLKSLKYGKDTIGGGYSGQPYIQKPIPDSFNDLGANEDFILRGGVNAIGDAATDVKRLTKMFFDLKSPNGVLFIAKQNLLSQTSVRTQTSDTVNEGIYTPLNTLAQAGVVELGGHLNKQGVNPFTETGAYANSEILYSVKVKPTQLTEENRLAELYRAINTDRSINNWNFSGFDLNVGTNILTYNGGPNSILGVGKTNIRYSTFRTGKQNPQYVNDPNFFTGKNNQRSIDANDKQVGGLQIYVGEGNKSWIKGEIIFDANGNFYTDELPSFNINSPQSSSLYQANDGQYNYNSSLSKQNISGSTNGGKYSFYNPLKYAGISSAESKYGTLFNVYDAESKSRDENGNPNWYNNVYIYENGSLKINPKVTGSNTWTPIQTNRIAPYGSNYILGTDKSITYNVSSSKGVTNTLGLTQPTFLNPSVYQPSGSGKPVLTPNDKKVRANDTFTYKNPFVNPNINLNPDKLKGSPKIQDFRQILRSSLRGETRKQAENSGATPNAPIYSNHSIGDYINGNQLGNPGQRSGKSYVSYTKGVSYSGNIKALDKINASPIGTGVDAPEGGSNNDLVTFNIQPWNSNGTAASDQILNFRAFLGSFSDTYSAEINSQKYVGRGENFYTYNGQTRKISLSWTVAALSKQELIPMYKKLSFLASNTAPIYNSGFMQGPLVSLTVGGYIYELPGYIDGLTFEMGEDSTWEIGINDNGGRDTTVAQLTHIIKVTGFSFIPIPTYLPQKGAHFIDLWNGSGTLWGTGSISLT
jgi:hypothetical protein